MFRASALVALALAAVASAEDRRSPQEVQDDQKLLDSLSPMMRAAVKYQWDALWASGVEKIGDGGAAHLQRFGLGKVVVREAIRYSKADPACAEFRRITECETDAQYVAWAICLRRKNALEAARSCSVDKFDPRDHPAKNIIVEAGGGDWVARGGKPKPKD